MPSPAPLQRVTLVLALTAALGCDGTPPAPAEAPEAPARPEAAARPEAPARPPSFADLVEEARPAVINLYTRTRTPTPAPQVYLPFVPRERISESLGSAFLIDPSGLALTNHHVVRGASEIEARLLDDRRFKARVIGSDPQTDIALIQLEADRPLPHLGFAAPDELRVGDWVVAIGNPLGLTSTVTAGIASATGRHDVPLGELVYQDFIQTDASINPGNSGGPLLDVEGRVVGINTAITEEGAGIGFAIPVHMVRELLPQLKAGRVRRSWLGIYVDDVDRRLAAELPPGAGSGGALVTEVIANGPAEAARLVSGDVIVELDGERVRDASHLAWLAATRGIGRSIEIALWRGDRAMRTKLVLGELPEPKR